MSARLDQLEAQVAGLKRALALAEWRRELIGWAVGEYEHDKHAVGLAITIRNIQAGRHDPRPKPDGYTPSSPTELNQEERTELWRMSQQLPSSAT